MNTIAFYVGSRYTLFISFLVKTIYHKNDRTVMFLSDILKNWKELKDRIDNSGEWDDVIIIHEEAENVAMIEEQANIMAERDDINVIYIPHIMRRFTHIYTNIVKDDVKIVLLEEGNLTPVIQKEYQNVYVKSLDENYPEFNFGRVNEVMVFVPEVCDPVGNAPITRICIEKFLCGDLKGYLKKLNYIFGYMDEIVKDKVIVIDDSYGSFGVVPEEYEFWCAKQMVKGIKNILIKLKPCNSNLYNLSKWGKNVRFSKNSNVPFEILFLNWYILNDMPKGIVSYPTSANANILLFAKTLNIKSPVIVDINIMIKRFMREDLFITHDLTTRRYWNYYKDNNNVWYEPESWSEYFSLLQHLGLCNKRDTDYDIVKEECEWFKERYYFHVVKGEGSANSKVQKFKEYYLTVVRLLDNLLLGKSYKKYFEQKGWVHIGLFGAGIIAEELRKILLEEGILIDGFIVSSKQSQKSVDNIVYQYDEIETLHLDVVILTIPFVAELVIDSIKQQVKDVVSIEEIIGMKREKI